MNPCHHIRKSGPQRNMLRVLLILSMWQAPIPFLHCHSLRAEDAGRDTGLQQHLVRFHRDALRHPGHPAGWHVHFGLPAELLGSPDDDEGCPARPRNDSSRFERAALAETRLELSSAASPDIERLLPGPDPTDLRACHGKERPPVGSFLTTFVGSTTINVLVCVARC